MPLPAGRKAKPFTRGQADYLTLMDDNDIVFVTGPEGPSSVLTHTERLSTIRIGQGAAAGPGITMAARDAEEFVQRWRPWH